MIKESQLKHYRIEHEGHVWHIDAKIWPSSGNRKGLLRVYRVHGDIITPDLMPALQLFADTLGLRTTIESYG